jgi:hypothetical protein
VDTYLEYESLKISYVKDLQFTSESLQIIGMDHEAGFYPVVDIEVEKD